MVSIVQEAGWEPGQFGPLRRISSSAGFDSRTVQPVA